MADRIDDPARFHERARARGIDVEAWTEIMNGLVWDELPEELWAPGDFGGRWFAGGRLNLSSSCLDQHLGSRGDRPAVLWEGEPGDRRVLSYRRLHADVSDLAAALRRLGVGVGDRIAIHMGWLPEAVTALLASVRIGAVCSVIPASLPVEALADRLSAQQPRLIFTSDGAWRHGTVMPLKARADEALSAVDSVEHTIVVRRTGMDVTWYEGDRWYHDLIGAGALDGDGGAIALDSQAPVFAVSLANRRGRPVTTLHAAAHLGASSLAVHRSLRTEGGEPFWCAGDISWAVAQFSGVLGPLLNGDAAVMYEGTLDVPDHRRAWDILERYGVGTMLTSPSVVRAMRAWQLEDSRSTPAAPVRRVVTAGEVVDAELQAWIRHDLAGAEVEFGDAWGQLPLGGIVFQTGDRAGDGIPGIGHEIVAEGDAPDGRGEVVLNLPWPGMIQGVEGEAGEEVAAQWTRRGPERYSTGDIALPGEDGRLVFLGRTDAVVSISGQLVSFTEVHDVLADHPFVESVIVTVRPDARQGRSIVAAVVLADEYDDDDASIAVDLMHTVRDLIGGLARPRSILILDRLGEDLAPEVRDRAIVALAPPSPEVVRRATWEQLRAAAGQA